MAVTPTGPLGAPKDALRTALGACTTWQTWTDTAPEDAPANIYFSTLDAEGATYPFALIGSAGIHRVKTTDGRTTKTLLGIYLAIVDDLGYELTDDDAITTFENNTGPLMLELISRAWGAGLPLAEFELNAETCAELGPTKAQGAIRQVDAQYTIFLEVS